MKKLTTTKSFERLFLMLIVMFALPILTYAQQRDELQELIDQLASAPATRAAGTVTDIDLSAYSEPRTTTLYIRNGVNVRFVNGTLTRATSLTDAPLVQIQDDSKLHLAESSKISGNNFITQNPIVNVISGELVTEGGDISGNSEGGYRIGASVWENDQNTRVRMESGLIQCLFQKEGSLYAYGGQIEVLSVSGIVYLKNNIIIRNCSFDKKESYLYVEDGTLESSADITLRDYSLGQVVVRNVASKETANCFKLGGSEKENYVLSYEIDKLVVREKPNPVQVIDNLEPGTLPDRIPPSVREIVEELTITGKLNGTDIGLIRGLCNKTLKKLDIANCSIVSGGGNYAFIYGNTNGVLVDELPMYPVEVSQSRRKVVTYPVGVYTKDDVIGHSMFRKLSTIEYIALPNTVKSIGHFAFNDSPSLKTVVIGENVKTIVYSIFEGCENISDIQFDKCKYLHCEKGIVYNEDYSQVIMTLPYYTMDNTLTLRSTVDSINYAVFANRQSIEKVILPDALVALGQGVFQSCENLSEIKFSEELGAAGISCVSLI